MHFVNVCPFDIFEELAAAVDNSAMNEVMGLLREVNKEGERGEAEVSEWQLLPDRRPPHTARRRRHGHHKT